MSSGSTTRAHVPYPVSTDNAVVSTDLQAIATWIDTNGPLYVQSNTQPASPILGMLWWCPSTTSTNYGFNYYDGAAWYNVTSQILKVSSTAPTALFYGLVWYDTTNLNGELKYWNGSTWTKIIPNAGSSNLFLKSGDGSTTGLTWTAINQVPSTSGVVNNAILQNISGTPTWSQFNISIPTNALLNATIENMQIVASPGATGTISLYANTSAFYYYVTAATAAFNINLTANNSGGTINSLLSTGQSITFVFLNTNGTTAYTIGTVAVDGTTITPIWQTGTTPTGNASSIDAYTFTIIKTASATYKVLASLTKFA